MKLKLLAALFIFTVAGAKAQTPAVSLFPNPASSVVTISFPEPPQGEITVVLNDILGNKIETFHFKASENVSIDLTSLKLPNGMYILKINHGGMVHLRRLSVKTN